MSVSVSSGGEEEDFGAEARAELARALDRLRNGGGLVVRLTDALSGVLGRTLRLGTSSLSLLPGVSGALQGVVEAALRRAFDVAVTGLDRPGEAGRSQRFAGPLVIASGAVSGLFGVGGLAPDLAVTTLAIMREIARIAVEEGEDLLDPQARAACLEVFALQPGGDVPMGSVGEGGYFATRFLLRGQPLAFLLKESASRFGMTLSQKLALQAVPVVGALTAATVNRAFLQHYRDLARAHFTVRRLERTYGAEAVREVAGLPPRP